jgi:formylglycine-generating enzyme required for sulfatase activity
MDQYEAPNKRGATPIVMTTFHQAESWCASRGKRLCTEQEFETACEGPQLMPFFYGWSVDGSVCNTSRKWRQFDDTALRAGGETSQREVKRLWQGWPSGHGERCRTQDGIYDLLGNVEEWVVSRAHRKYRGALMGGWWAKPWVGCRSVNDAHYTHFAFYQVGFRCCADPISSEKHLALSLPPSMDILRAPQHPYIHAIPDWITASTPAPYIVSWM